MSVKTPEECRANAEACLRFARESTDAYAREALLELAAEFQKLAEEIELERRGNCRLLKRK